MCLALVTPRESAGMLGNMTAAGYGYSLVQKLERYAYYYAISTLAEENCVDQMCSDVARNDTNHGTFITSDSHQPDKCKHVSSSLKV